MSDKRQPWEENPWLAPGVLALGERVTKAESPSPNSVDKGQYGDEDYQDGKPHKGKGRKNSASLVDQANVRNWEQWDAERAKAMFHATADKPGKAQGKMQISHSEQNSKHVTGFDSNEHATRFGSAMKAIGYSTYHSFSGTSVADHHVAVIHAKE